MSGENTLIPKFIRKGIQERLPKYGQGDTKRVWQMVQGDYCFGVNLGDIAKAPTDAVMCPTTSILELGEGAVENRLAREMGEGVFEQNARHIQDLINEILRNQGAEQFRAAKLLSDFFKSKTGLREGITPEEIAINIMRVAHIAKLGIYGEQMELFQGAAIPLPSGELKKAGIDTVIAVNVTPVGRSMTPEDMSMFTQNACQVADLTGAQSITIPAVGTGFAAALGFGLSQKDSIEGFFDGALSYSKQAGYNPTLKTIDYNIYAPANDKNAQDVASLLAELHIV